MVKAVREAEKAIGKVSYELTEKQLAGRAFSRSLYVTKDIRKGEVITEQNVQSKRPGYGMHPKHLKAILGKVTNRDLQSGDRFLEDYLG